MKECKRSENAPYSMQKGKIQGEEHSKVSMTTLSLLGLLVPISGKLPMPMVMGRGGRWAYV